MSAQELDGVPGPGQSLTIDSSFVPEMPEVKVMREALSDPNRAFIFPYEMLQNSIDYHGYSDDPENLPYVVCVLPDGKRVLNTQLTPNTPNPVRVEFHNRIGPTGGLDPYQVADIAHTAESATLGKHGRGGTVAATAALVDNHISSIDYVSVGKKATGETYAWRGKGAMKILDPVHQSAPRFVIDYEYLPNHGDETIVGIDNPDEVVVEALRSAPNTFLPANPRYEGCKLKGGENVQKIPNLLTVGAVEGAGEVFTDEELSEAFYVYSPDLIKTIAPRVEILPDELVGRDPNSKDTEYLYEGGLRLQRWSFRSKYALNWSFYGFGDPRLSPKYDCSISRGKDSIHIDGDAEGLIALTLKHCQDPAIFSKILENCLGVTDPTKACIESQISQSSFKDLPEETVRALTSGWQSIAKKAGLAPDTLITTDELIRARLEQEGKNAVVLQSKAMVPILTKALGLQDATEALGVKEIIKETGESMRYTRGDLKEHEQKALSGLIKFMSENRGTFTADQGKITADIPPNFHDRYADLSRDLRGFIEDYLCAGGSVNIKALEAIFEVEMSGVLHSGAEGVMKIKKGVAATPVDRLELDLSSHSTHEERIRNDLLARLKDKLGKFIKPDSTIDWEAYKSSAGSTLEDLDRQIAERQRRLKDKAFKQFDRNENPLGKKLARGVKDMLSWSNIAKASTTVALLGSLYVGGGRLLSDLAQRGVNIPGVDAITNTLDLKGLKIALPFAKESAAAHYASTAFPPYESRMPDRISPAELRGVAPQTYATVLQLPRGIFTGQNGEAIGYFPSEQFVDDKPLLREDQKLTPFTGAFRVNSLEQAPIKADEDALVYKPDMTFQSLYPPSGWEITNLYQVGGNDPLINTEGALFWNSPKDMPKEVIVVAKKLKQETLPDSSGRLNSLGNRSPFGEYEPKFDITKSMELNDKLNGDPRLQSIHKGFLQEMIKWQISDNKDKGEASQIVDKYLTLFSQYSNTRNYALDFQIDRSLPSYNALISIANKPDGKYFCSVASNVTLDFLSSVGIKVANQPGYTLYNVNGTLFADIAHQNNVVYLPNGELLLVDNTPYESPEDAGNFARLRREGVPITNATVNPYYQSRAESLRRNLNQSPNSLIPLTYTPPEQVVDKVDTWNGIGETAAAVGIPIGAAALAFFAVRRFAPGLREKEIRNRLERSVRDNNLAPVEVRLVSSIEDHLANAGDSNPAQMEATTRQYIDLLLKFNLREHGPALQWLIDQPAGREIMLGENGLRDRREAFTKVAQSYKGRDREVSDRFPPSLRADFLYASDHPNTNFVPAEFSTLYDLASVVYTRDTGEAQVMEGRIEAVDDILQRKFAAGEIGPNGARLVGTLYQQLSGRPLRETLSRNEQR